MTVASVPVLGSAMSDGPYRTLNLRQQWKRLLKRAYQRAFDSQDVIDAICPALERDCAWEITKDFMPALRDYCTDKAADLFDDRNSRLEQLKHVAAGRGTLGPVIADCAQEALLQGKTGRRSTLILTMEWGYDDDGYAEASAPRAGSCS